MKGFIFYLEYPNHAEKRKATRKSLGNHSGNCIAVDSDRNSQLEQYRVNLCYPSIQGVFNWKNSDCCSATVSVDYLSNNCKRISEAQAREIHPKLFSYIEE